MSGESVTAFMAPESFSVPNSAWSKAQLCFLLRNSSPELLSSPLLCADKKLKVTGLKKGVQYEFRVAAVNAAGAGQPSEPSEPALAQDPASK